MRALAGERVALTLVAPQEDFVQARSLMCGPSVVCECIEAEQALAWAKAHTNWDDDDPALAVVSSVSGD